MCNVNAMAIQSKGKAGIISFTKAENQLIKKSRRKPYKSKRIP